MIRVCLNCYANSTTDSVYQWDQNHELELTGTGIDGISAVHFCNKKSENAIVVTPDRVGDTLVVPIPNILLEEEYNIIAYVHVVDGSSAKTVEIINIPLITRPKPDDYQFTDNLDVMNFERLEKDIVDFIATMTEDQEKFKTDFMTEYNNRVASGYFASPESVTRLNSEIEKIKEETIGENLLSYPYYEYTHIDNNVLWTDNGDGTVTADGENTSTGQSSFVCKHRNDLKYALELEPGTYTISGCPSNGSNATYFLEVARNVNGSWNVLGFDYGSGATFTLSEKSQLQVQCVVSKGTSVSNLVFKPMIEKGTEAHSYQPNMLSRPKLRRDLDNVGRYNIENLFNVYSRFKKPHVDVASRVVNGNGVLNGIKKTENGVILTHEGDRYIDISHLEVGESITVSVKIVGGTYTPATSTIASCYFDIRDKNGVNLTDSAVKGLGVMNLASTYGNVTYTMTQTRKDAGVCYLYLQIWAYEGDIFDNLELQIMIEMGDNAHPYQPYNLSRQELRRVCDRVEGILDNLLDYPYYDTTKIENDITWTDNGTGNIRAEGTAIDDTKFICSHISDVDKNPLVLPPGTYEVKGYSGGGSEDMLYIGVSKLVDDVEYVIAKDYGHGARFTLTEETQIEIALIIKAGATVNRFDFKPEIRNVQSNQVIRNDLDATMESVSEMENDLIGIGYRLRRLDSEGSWVTITPAGTYDDTDYNTGATVKVLEDIKYSIKGCTTYIRGNISLVKFGSASMFDTITLGEVYDKPSSDLSFLFAVAGVNGKTPVGFSIKVTTEGKVQLAPSVLGDVSSTYGGRYAITTGAFEFSYLAY